MGKSIYNNFNNIHRILDKIGIELIKTENKQSISYFNKLEKAYGQLRSEVEREIRISNIERHLYSYGKSLSETLDDIVNIIKKEFGFSRLDIVLIDHQTARVMQRFSKGEFVKEDFEKLLKNGVFNHIKNYCLKNKTPLIINDVKKQDIHWKTALDLDIWAHGTFPLYFHEKNGKDELVGYLHATWSEKDFKSGKFFTQKDIEEIFRLGEAITMAIREAKLSYFEHSIIRIQNSIGSTRIDMSKVPDNISEESKPQAQMCGVLDIIIHTLNAEYGGIILKEKQQAKPLFFRNHRGHPIYSEAIHLSPRPMTGVISRSLYDGLSVIENEIYKLKDRMDLEIDRLPDEIQNLIAVPLIEPYSEEGRLRKDVIGVIILLNKYDDDGNLIVTDYKGSEGGFSTQDKKILESISPHIETIISNTKSHSELRQMSITDGLTELANHSHFMNNLLTLEFQRSYRYGTPLSVLLLDIDHFKIFNDIFGHQVGDLVLKETARILRENTRNVDHIARYGGEEFAVLLHNTNMKDALIYAEKIKNKISSGQYIEKIQRNDMFYIMEAYKRFRAILSIGDSRVREAKISIMHRYFNLNLETIVNLIEEKKYEQAEEKIFNSFKVTISIGLAFYPNPHITSKKDLLTSADMLLLKAKEHGRNRVEALTI